MFCPEGYITLIEIDEALDQFSWSSTPPSAKNATGCEAAPGDVPMDERKAYKDWLFSAFLELYAQDLRVALPTGLVLRTAPWVFDFTADDGGRGDWLGLGQYARFPEDRPGRLSIRPVTLVLVSHDSFTIDGSLTGDPADSEALKAIDGYPVCFKRPEDLKSQSSSADDWARRIERAYHSRAKDGLGAGTSRSGGRPTKQRALEMFYLQLFPNGHGDLSKKEVLGQINERHGLIASVPTLDRFLKGRLLQKKTLQNPHQNP